MNKQLSPKRKILIEVQIDWEGYDDVSDELIIEDAIQAKVDGVGWELLTSSSKVVTTEEVYRWVKASERLPDYGVQVFVKHSKGRKDITKRIHGLPWPDWAEYWLEEFKPLPSPPKN